MDCTSVLDYLIYAILVTNLVFVDVFSNTFKFVCRKS